MGIFALVSGTLHNEPEAAHQQHGHGLHEVAPSCIATPKPWSSCAWSRSAIWPPSCPRCTEAMPSLSSVEPSSNAFTTKAGTPGAGLEVVADRVMPLQAPAQRRSAATLAAPAPRRSEQAPAGPIADWQNDL